MEKNKRKSGYFCNCKQIYYNQEFNEGWIEWNFKHTMTSNEKVYFAFFYPWSNQDNTNFLNRISLKAK